MPILQDPINTLDIRIGQRLRESREAGGFSRKALAEAVGITHQQLHKYEAGINRVAASRLVALAAVLKVEVGTLLQQDATTNALSSRALLLARQWQHLPDPHIRSAIRGLLNVLAEELA